MAACSIADPTRVHHVLNRVSGSPQRSGSSCEYAIARDNIIALGNSGTGKTHVAGARSRRLSTWLFGHLRHRGRSDTSRVFASNSASAIDPFGPAHHRGDVLPG